MKKITALLLVLVMALGLSVGCAHRKSILSPILPRLLLPPKHLLLKPLRKLSLPPNPKSLNSPAR